MGEEAAARAESLRGKGLWLPFSGDLDGALEMASAIGATHLLYRVGVRGTFFVEAARHVLMRAREAGLTPLAWLPLSLDHPLAEAEVVLKALRIGYAGVVLEVGSSADGKTVATTALGRKILADGGAPEQLFYASFPDIGKHPGIPYQELNRFCRGGFMPWCTVTRGRSPKTVIDRWAYGEHARWTKEWGDIPPIYPILAVGREEEPTGRPSLPEFLEWAQALASHNPPFFSFYGWGIGDREVWPILASLGASAAPLPVTVPSPPLPPTPPEEIPPATARFHVVTVNDTIWGICKRYGISRHQFWEWNGHLWDDQGLPRDEVYLQEGWRVRVG